jgi:hypothetical protein
MKKIIALGTVCLLTLINPLRAQPGSAVRWDNRPQVHAIPDEYKNESAVFILEKRRIVYQQEMKETYVYRTVHRIIKVLDDKGIEAFNRMTVYSGGSRKIEHIQARTVVPGGKIYEVGMEEMKETRSEEGIPQYIFALKGLEPGAEVELLYTEKRPLAMFGTERFQFSVPVLKAEFLLISPERLQFETKGYNGFPEAKDSTADEKRYYHVVVNNVPGLKEERFSSYEAALQRIDYRLSYLPTEKPGIRQFTWNDLAKHLFNEYYTFTEKEKKAAAQFLKDAGVADKDTEEQKVRRIETAIKNNITVKADLPDEYDDCARMIEKRMATEAGLSRLFAACFTMAGVRHELGLSSDRSEYPLDEAFESWRGLEYFVFYFPRLQRYLYPSGAGYRMPVIPTAMLGNKGVFCKITTVGTLTSAVAVVRTINPLPAAQSDHHTDAEVQFSESLVPEVQLTQAFTGYSALSMRQVLAYLPKEKEKDLIADIMDIAVSSDDILDYKISGKSFAGYYENKPLTMYARIHAPGLMDKAGAKYLFKVGALIGHQAEMYQDEQRKLPVDMGYPHVLLRTLRIPIPKGYKVVNPEALVINKVYKDKEGNRTMAFVSGYKTEGNTLVVSIEEAYEQSQYPASEIAHVRDVINAAADFNKIVLILERE